MNSQGGVLPSGLRQKINELRMPELRIILKDMTQATGGKKADLVDRLYNSLSVRDGFFYHKITFPAYIN